ncbi:hypothetical protein CWRG_00715 [Chthonomonas calidirosea]|uniref:Uncharacterized protein n=1 Tax=Chthonomonas calidirosea (strain DSM 23976 / ICMP 18418 / T49) TaxID=1303518 RepID=S0EWW7_CHTCT|nr:hypothetical protein CCALI_00433 [Chthonomonas calidirosea T49]CEK14094.1 hypothetical protein CWRG_00715 [Chthonomonas calidirosea]CEK14095.1 hypothetical protein CP488_00723 [Chthonomonas calidirosea]CEK15272.1 hypothetical protein CTKA_00723 [Chthonomonas calidirosea]
MTDERHAVHYSFVDEESLDSTEDVIEQNDLVLEAFLNWMTDLTDHTSTQVTWHYANVEAFLEYLSTVAQTTVFNLNEFDLRWFLFHYYIRHDSSYVEEAAAHILPASLGLFFQFLDEERGWKTPQWILDALRNQAWFEKRLIDYRKLSALDLEAAELAYVRWNQELLEDLDNRLLLLPKELVEGVLWNEPAGWREAALYRQASRLWLRLREELLADATLSESDVREALLSAYTNWVRTPQERLENQSPIEVILAERDERAGLMQGEDGLEEVEEDE